MGRSSNLDKLRNARRDKAEGKSRLETYREDEEKDFDSIAIYDEVDENDYRRVVQKRLLGADFVVDDNGLGYADDGTYDWEPEGSDEEQEPTADGKRKKKSKGDKDEVSKKQRNAMDKFIAKSSSTLPKRAAPKALDENDDVFFANILAGVDSAASKSKKDAPRAQKASKPAKPLSKSVFQVFTDKPLLSRDSDHTRRRITVSSSPPPPVPRDRKNIDPEPDITSPVSSSLIDDEAISSKPAYESDDDAWDHALAEIGDDDNDDNLDLNIDSKETVKPGFARTNDDGSDDEVMEFETLTTTNLNAPIKRINIAASKPVVQKQDMNLKAGTESVIEQTDVTPVRQKADVANSHAWTSMNSALPVSVVSSPASSSVGMMNKIPFGDVVEDDGTVKMFWTDYCDMGDRLILFGKTMLKKCDKYVSCMLQIKNIKRRLFFLPRETVFENGTVTDIPVTMDDVYEEVANIFKADRVQWLQKSCVRKYAFELPGVPAECEYLEVLYPYSNKPLPLDLSGKTFSRVFGTDTALFEQFVLMQRVMGPCWLEIKNPQTKDVANMSWCKFEIGVDNPNFVKPMPDAEAPPLTLMSIALRTAMNHAENKQEIVAISARIFEDIPHDTTESPENLSPYTFTIVRPIRRNFPIGFDSEIKKHGRGTITTEHNEQALLSNFLVKIQKYDPDVFIGHNLDAVDLSLLFHRMKERKTPNWHRMGRLKRSQWPISSRGFTQFTDRLIVGGRLLCDLANDLGKSLMTKCQSWSLTEMCSLILSTTRYEAEDVDTRKENNWTDTATGMFEFVSHCELDTHFIAAIALKTQMLPLTKQLTNIAGNSWTRTLSGTRAERNEYILLHEFTKNKYIVPDKHTVKIGQSKKVVTGAEENEDDNHDDEAISGATKKKDKFKGGLVFEPEKGLYDKYVLVMDFNSLYPSIIQEFNICFTTVDRSHCSEDDDKVPDPPSSTVSQGILPRIIATLVNRRRQVKNLMKDPKATPAQLAQWDIKQQALKLTANSMYGCLGYVRSRFYARPLAMLTTYKGREILTNTKELAESMQLKVVYGDTDSVMINTNSDVYADALKIGNEFKATVNERYRLLEIDIDNVFRKLLLHAKKKYAALNCIEVNGKIETKMEIKGLDMRRREYCGLSKDASQYVLNQILSGEQNETVVEKIHEYLRDLGEKVRAGEIAVPKYTVYTKLGKEPEQYPGGKTMPQVHVALTRKHRGEQIHANDVIAFIIAAGDEQNFAERAHMPQDFTKEGSELHPDYEWYLVKQILPPIERLCGTISGTDSMHLASCLGLDTRKYMVSTSNSNTNMALNMVPLESTISDEERFHDADKLRLVCGKCKSTSIFEGLKLSHEQCTPKGIQCTQCSNIYSSFELAVQIELTIRGHITQYYESWLVCDDSSCGNRTRQMSVYGKRCIGKDGLAKSCRGIMKFEYSDRAIYNQLLYFDSIFNVDKAKNKGNVEVDALAEHNRLKFDMVRGIISKYLNDSGRRFVDFQNIFGFMA
ncbi:uncharacterized protein V1518DRAFT_417885 [Limtongia smithiae]|uniref:uncharacterized protein n=1 Tax=Limtongia smithiae TaxID=1125753 RepID=UPI0034CD07CC